MPYLERKAEKFAVPNPAFNYFLLPDLHTLNGGMGVGAVERDWRPFVYGGLASCTAEFGTKMFDALLLFFHINRNFPLYSHLMFIQEHFLLTPLKLAFRFRVSTTVYMLSYDIVA